MKEFSQITGSTFKYMTHEISHNLVSKLQSNDSSRFSFFESLIDKLGNCPGFIVEQKNTQNSDKITVLIIKNKNCIICVGNADFFSIDDLDRCDQLALAYHIIFCHSFCEMCKNLASLLGALLSLKDYGEPNRRTQLLEKL